MEEENLTVSQLIEELKNYDQDLKVRSEGCSLCAHEIIGVKEVQIDDKKPEVWLQISH